MVALSMADGYARLSGQPQCVIVHVDVGTQGLGAAVHNASCGRCPVLIFAGLSPLTDQGEYRGSRTEYIHWIQDVPDQKAIVSQYCRYTAEIKTGRNVKQMVARAVQFATSAPQGPVYLCGAREVMEEEIPEYSLRREKWGPVGPGALPEQAVEEVVNALVEAEEPLVITGYSGRNHDAPAQLVALADAIPGLRVLDTGGSDMCFPATHPASLGLRYGVDAAIPTADMILVLDCDVPWIPTQNAPKPTAKVYHIDIDPLKQQMPVGWIESHGTWRADSFTALRQLNTHIASSPHHLQRLSSEPYSLRRTRLSESYTARQHKIQALAVPNPNTSITTSYLTSRLRALLPEDTIFAIEAVTNTALVADALLPSIPGTWLNCGGGGLGWSGGAALGIKFAAGASRFVCQIVADGTFLFSVPGSVYWIAQRYGLPVLTIVLNNNGWHAPRRSLLLVHPEGMGSRVSDEALGISFRPCPDYAGIAVAAAGGRVWGGKAEGVGDLERLLGEAIGMVEGGVGAVLDCVLDAPMGVGEGGAEGKAVGQEEANGTVQSKGDDVLEEGAEERGGGKAVLVG
jgi:thiamine pyrophosphate-dependent acetolactate synthase large subunit-like protein